MRIHRTRIATATLVVAVVVLGLTQFGCVTTRHIDRLSEKIDRVERQNRLTQEQIAELDSIIRTGAETDNKLRNDLRVTVDEMNQQMAQLLASYNDLMEKIHEIETKQGSRLYSSPGSNRPTTPPSQPGNDTTTTVTQPSIDCGTTYDDAFVVMLQSDYQNAIDGFQEYLDNCPNHESAENAHYWVGECYYSLEKYTEAIESFMYLVENYKSSTNLSRAYYKLARSHQELGQKADAKRYFQKLVDDYGGSLEAEQAKDRLKELD